MNPAAETSNELNRLRSEIMRGTRVISLSGLTSIASKAFILAQIRAETGVTFVVITDTNKEIEAWSCDLEFFNSRFQIPDSKLNSRFQIPNSKLKEKESDIRHPESGIWNLESGILTLPSFETDVYSGVSPHAETQEQRALTLWKLTAEKPDFLIVSAKSLITKTLAPEEIKSLGAHLKRDADFPPEDLIEKLVAGGYVREEPIKSIGEFSVRGGILDVWSPTQENPVRIEFFGDTVDSIREFDAETQLSIGQIKEISIAPMREFSARSQDFNDWAFFARERFADERQARAVRDRTDFAEEGESFSGWEFMIPLVKPRASSVFDFLAKDCVFIIDEPVQIEQTLVNYYETLEKRRAEILEAGEIGLETEELFLNAESLREKLDGKPRIELRALGKTAAQTDEQFQAV